MDKNLANRINFLCDKIRNIQTNKPLVGIKNLDSFIPVIYPTVTLPDGERVTITLLIANFQILFPLQFDFYNELTPYISNKFNYLDGKYNFTFINPDNPNERLPLVFDIKYLKYTGRTKVNLLLNFFLDFNLNHNLSSEVNFKISILKGKNGAAPNSNDEIIHLFEPNTNIELINNYTIEDSIILEIEPNDTLLFVYNLTTIDDSGAEIPIDSFTINKINITLY